MVFHQDINYKVGSSGGWNSYGVHDFSFPLRTGDADPTEEHSGCSTTPRTAGSAKSSHYSKLERNSERRMRSTNQ